MDSLDEFEGRIGYRFRNRDLLRRALTHYSHVGEKLPAGTLRTATQDYEQLEFLGDAVLGFLVSERLLREFPHAHEGELSQNKALLVSKNHLFATAERLELGRYLFLGRAEERSGGRQKRAMLADSLEALIASVYLDGGLTEARRWIETHVLPATFDGFRAGRHHIDYKTTLQELAHARKLPAPVYEVTREEGPANARHFTVAVRVGADVVTEGKGSTKKSASQAAATEAYRKLISQP